MEIPVKKDESYSVEITDLNNRGQGIARVNDFTIFVNGGLPGDQGKVRISEVKKNYGVGKLISITKPSEDRITPKCPYAHECGGCQMQGLSYEAQLNIKTNKVKNDIKRIGKLENVVVHDALGMDEPFRYRNKAPIPVGTNNGRLSIGLYKWGTHDIVDTSSCIIQHETSDKVIEVLREYMNKYKVKPYDEKTGKGLVRHIMTKVAFKTGDLMIVLVTNGRNIPHKEDLINMLTSKIDNIRGIIQNVNTANTNLILGPEMITLYGVDKIVDYIDDLKFNISPQSFFQVNPIQTEVLYGKALEYADLKGDETVFDLYCGIGTISLFLAKKAKKVYGIEVVKQAIIDAKENARINDVENVEFFDGSTEAVLPRLYKEGIEADVVVLDPPRKGAEESVLETIVKMSPQKVVYVSCNPSTLARDLKYLDEHGYKTVEVQPVDMFPHSMHVEAVTLLTRKNEL